MQSNRDSLSPVNYREYNTDLTSETRMVLKEWCSRILETYKLENIESILPIKQSVFELIRWRAKLRSGRSPQSELKDLKKNIIRKIDVGNSLLGYDLIVRGQSGQRLGLSTCSVLELYSKHETVRNQIESDTRCMQAETSRRKEGAYSLLLDIHSLCLPVKIRGKYEITVALYDCNQEHFFSDTLVTYDHNELPRALFTDLGSKDMERIKVLLICRILRVGPLEGKDSSLSLNRPKTSTLERSPVHRATNHVRQPYCLALTEITQLFKANATQDPDLESTITTTMQLHHYLDEGFMTTLQRHMPSGVGGKAELINGYSEDSGDKGLKITLRLLNGSKEECYANYGHLFVNKNKPALLRKMGFPEVIQSEDVRNDLYVTLNRAELTNCSKQTDKNIEVRVCVCDARGVPMTQNVVVCCEEEQKRASFHSLVHYHNDRPNWSEVVKLALPYEVLTEQDQCEQKGIHVKFTFRHRSSNEGKDKTEKPFALAFLKLIQDDQTIVKDDKYDLLIYKIGDKRSAHDSETTAYMLLFDTRSSYNLCHKEKQQHRISSGMYTLCLKDEFCIETVTCSTVVTQSVDLLGLLGWRHIQANRERRSIKTSLSNLKKSDEEIVKVYSIQLVGQRRYHNFKPVMDTYLDCKFSATLAWSKLLKIVLRQVSNLDTVGDHYSGLLMLQNMDYIVRFILKSRERYVAMMSDDSLSDQFEFRQSLEKLLKSLANQMRVLPNDNQCKHSGIYRGAILKHMPDLVQYVTPVLGKLAISHIFRSLFENIPSGCLHDQRLRSLKLLIQGELMLQSDSRQVLVRLATRQLNLMLENEKELPLCAALLRSLLERLLSTNTLSVESGDDSNISDVVIGALRSVQQTLIHLMHPRTQPKLLAEMMAEYLSLLDSLTPHLFLQLTRRGTQLDLVDFLKEVLQMFDDVSVCSPFPNDWFHMICLQNKCIREALALIKGTLDKCGFFEFELWNQYFNTLVSFITQPHLAMEQFPATKRESICRSRDVRQECVTDLRSSWFTLDPIRKLLFVPCMVKPFLRVCLVCNATIRQTVLPIFYDMLTTEFAYPQPKGELKTAVMYSLDELSEEGLGDIEFIAAFDKQYHILGMYFRVEKFSVYSYKMKILELGNSNPNSSIQRECALLARNVQGLMKRLLELRLCAVQYDSIMYKMKAVFRLFEFYEENGLKHLSVRYLFKLLALNNTADNNVEAAFTMLRLSDEFKWVDTRLSDEFKCQSLAVLGCDVMSECELKECLYVTAIAKFDAGNLWELAIRSSDQLAKFYETSLDYEQLAKLLVSKASFYGKIVRESRLANHYYLVGFYGTGFPESLANCEFIYRSKPLEMRAEFESRLHATFPSAKLLKSLDRPSWDIKNSFDQYILVVAVNPCTISESMLSAAHSNIKWYKKHNEVNRFRNDVPRRDIALSHDSIYYPFSSNDDVNVWKERRIYVTSQPLPDLLSWKPLVSDESTLLTPLECAVDNITESNRSLWESIEQCRPFGADKGVVSQLQMKLKGMILPEVQKGSIVYHDTLLGEEFIKKCNDDELKLVEELKHALSVQAILLELGLVRHKDRMISPNTSPATIDLHNLMVESYLKLKPKLQYIKMKSMLNEGETIALSLRSLSVARPPMESQRSSTANLNDNQSARSVPMGWMGISGSAFSASSSSLVRNFNRKVTNAGHELIRRQSANSLDSTDLDASTNSAIALTETVTSLRPPRPRNESVSSRGSPVRHPSVTSIPSSIAEEIHFDVPPLPPRPYLAESKSVEASPTPKRFTLPKKHKPLPPLPVSPKNDDNLNGHTQF